MSEAKKAPVKAAAKPAAQKAVAKAPAKKAAPAPKAEPAPKPAAKAPVVKKASNKTAEIVDAEVVQAMYRKPKRPTLNGISKFGFAVVMLAWVPEEHGSDPANPADRDFEGLDNAKDMESYAIGQQTWAEEDVDEHGDMFHAIVQLDATNPVHIKTVEVVAADKEWARTTKAHLLANPDVLFSTTKRQAVKEGVANAKKVVKKQAEPKKPTKAAGDVLAKARAAKPDAREAKEAAAKDKVDDLMRRNAEAKARREKRLAEAAGEPEAAPVAPRPRKRVAKQEAPPAEGIGKTDVKAFVKAGAAKKSA